MSLKQSPGELFQSRMQSPWFRWCRFWRQFWNNRWRYLRHPVRSRHAHKFMNAALPELLNKSDREFSGTGTCATHSKPITRSQQLAFNRRMAEGKEIPYEPY